MRFWNCSDVSAKTCALHAGIIWLILSVTTLSLFLGLYKEVYQLQTCLRRDLLIAMVFYGCLATLNSIASLFVALAVMRQSLGLIRAAVIALTFTMIFSCIFFSFISVVTLVTQRTLTFRLLAIFLTGLACLLHILVHASVREYQDVLKAEPLIDDTVSFSWRKNVDA